MSSTLNEYRTNVPTFYQENYTSEWMPYKNFGKPMLKFLLQGHIQNFDTNH